MTKSFPLKHAFVSLQYDILYLPRFVSQLQVFICMRRMFLANVERICERNTHLRLMKVGFVYHFTYVFLVNLKVDGLPAVLCMPGAYLGLT